jgi:zinc/manganese transport system permease protein
VGRDAVLIGDRRGERQRFGRVIGTTLAWILGLGVFFLAVYSTHSAAGNSAANVTVLFGSIFGISVAQAQLATWIAGR